MTLTWVTFSDGLTRVTAVPASTGSRIAVENWKCNELGPPDGTPIDNALVVWHSAGTEIMGSARPAQDGDICLGIWEKIGKSRYKLNVTNQLIKQALYPYAKDLVIVTK